MKNLMIVAALAAVCLTSCLTSKAREKVLLPAAKSAWSSISTDIAHGVAVGIDEDEITQAEGDLILLQSSQLGTALKNNNVMAMRTAPWPELRQWAIRGYTADIEAGALSQGAAMSLMERLSQFEQALAELTAWLKTPMPQAA